MGAEVTSEKSTSASGSFISPSDNSNNMCQKRVKSSMMTRHPKPSRSCSIHCNMRHFVKHNYHDHFYDPFVLEPVTNGEQKRKVHRGGVATPFPEKLHYMLCQVDYGENVDIVSWQPHGRCFVVHKPKEFVEQIMPRFFKQTKLTSFQRQLNLYGFSRLTSGIDRGGYYHELFIRGRMDLCRKMSRTRVKGNGSKGASSPETEPNFYAMAPCSETLPRSMSEDTSIDNANVGRFAVIPEDNVEQDSAAKVIELPSEIRVPIESNLNRIISPDTDDNVSKVSSSSEPISPIIAPETPISILPVISPLSGTRTTVSIVNFTDSLQNFLIPSEVSISDVHSGDKLLFEGLPFHYLETKDVEDSLLVLENGI